MEQLQEELVNAFRASTVGSIKKQCNTEVEPQGAIDADQARENSVIAASIGLVGANYGGSANLLFPKQTFLGLMSMMLGEDFQEIEDGLEDGAAELLNIIFGQSKTTLNEKGHDVAMAIPTLLEGSPVGFEYPQTQGVFIESFKTSAGDLFLEIALEDKKQDTTQSSAASGEIDVVKFFEPFAKGTRQAFETLCGLQITPGKPSMKDPAHPKPFDVAGFVGIVSDHFIGSYTLCFPAPSFLGVISKMLGEEITSLDSEIADGAAEIANIVFGNAKTALNDRGSGLKMAIPTVIKGGEINSKQQSEQSIVIAPFQTEVGDFLARACLGSI